MAFILNGEPHLGHLPLYIDMKSPGSNGRSNLYRHCIHSSNSIVSYSGFLGCFLSSINVIIKRVNTDIVINTGDITSDSLESEYRDAKDFLDQIRCDNIVSIIGNHDKINLTLLLASFFISTPEKLVCQGDLYSISFRALKVKIISSTVKGVPSLHLIFGFKLNL